LGELCKHFTDDLAIIAPGMAFVYEKGGASKQSKPMRWSVRAELVEAGVTTQQPFDPSTSSGQAKLRANGL
jgi:hypothetical protein